jgi:hypothetical protein
MQHAPVGVVVPQGCVVQFVPSPRYWPPSAWHSCCVRITHWTNPPLPMQQAPVGVCAAAGRGQAINAATNASPRSNH